MSDGNDQQAKMVGEQDIVVAIGNAIGRLGFADLTLRQVRAVFAAGKSVFAALAKPHNPATPASGFQAWLESDDTCYVSLFMARQLALKNDRRLIPPCSQFPAGHIHSPVRPGDFQRCLGLTMAAPEFRHRIGEMKQYSPAWRAVVDHWDELESILKEEYPTGETPRLAAKMAEIISSEKKVDGVVDLAERA